MIWKFSSEFAQYNCLSLAEIDREKRLNEYSMQSLIYLDISQSSRRLFRLLRPWML